MKYWGLLLLVGIFFCLTGVAAEANLEVDEIVNNNVVVSEIGNFVSYDLVINNLGEEDSFRVFTLVGVRIEPSESFVLGPGMATVPITAYLGERILEERRGPLFIEYQIKGRNRDLYKDKFLVKIVELEDVLDISYGDLHPDDNSVEIYISNNEDVVLSNLTAVFDSVFFRESFEIDLEPYGNETFSVLLNGVEEDLVAGPYIVSSTILAGEGEVEIEGVVDFLEKEGVSVEDYSRGIIIRTKTVEKMNKGNTLVTAEVSIEKDVFSRLFTTHSREPIETIRQGLNVEYIWREDLNPGETLSISSTTNYTLPFFGFLVLIGIAVFARYFYLRVVSVKKKTFLVRTKGGEFALRIVLRVKARKTVENLQLIDSLPAMTKLYDKFGKKPDKIDKEHRRLVWQVGHLGKGQERVYSYVIYSKLNVVGRLELPVARALYEKDGEPGEAVSNRAFFAAENV